MKDSSRADAEFIDTACHDPEFISAPSLPRPRGICHRVKLPRPENHRRSFPTDIHRPSPPPDGYHGCAAPWSQIYSSSIRLSRPGMWGEVVFIPLPSPQQAEGKIYRHRFLRLGIYRCRFLRPGIYWCWFSGGAIYRNRYENSIDMFIDILARKNFSAGIGRENLITRNLSIKGGSFDVDTRFHIDFYRGAFITSPFSVSRPEIHH